jgi:hypothetical protein
VRKKFKVCENKGEKENRSPLEMNLLRKSTYFYYLLRINSGQRSRHKFEIIIKLLQKYKCEGTSEMYIERGKCEY